jgi:chitin disaccharide deacetylase
VSPGVMDKDVRCVVVTADDFGIGPATSRGILDLAERGRVTCTVLLVNAPHAEEAVRLWRVSGAALELGWHACLTLDRPVLPPNRVRTLVRPDGRFHPLGGFLRRLLLGRVAAAEVEAELAAQLRRFLDLVGRPPGLVNGHHHVHLFPPVATALMKLLGGVRPVPYFRRVREPWAGLARFPGALPKRAFLGLCGRRAARALAAAGFPGNDWLALVSDPPFRANVGALAHWLGRLPPGVVELSCHPGYHDPALLGRDAAGHADLMKRAYDQQWLSDPAFRAACSDAGYALAAARDLFRGRPHPYPHAV